MKICAQQFEISLFDTAEHQALFELIDRNRERLAVFFAGTVAKTGSLEDTREYCHLIAQRIEEKSYFPYVIRNANNGEMIGFVDIKNIDWAIPKAEIGYFIDSRYEGRGITSQAVAWVVDEVVALHKFKKIYCRISPQNESSIAIAIKNEFELEGTLRREYKTLHNDIVDLHYFGKLFD